MLFFIFLALLTFLTLTVLIGRQWWLWRQGIVLSNGPLMLGRVLWLPVDYFSFNFPLWLKRGGKIIFFNFLVYARATLVVFRLLLVRLEKKFSYLIELVRGRAGHGNGKRGAASFFLQEIRQHQTDLRNGFKGETNLTH